MVNTRLLKNEIASFLAMTGSEIPMSVCKNKVCPFVKRQTLFIGFTLKI